MRRLMTWLLLFVAGVVSFTACKGDPWRPSVAAAYVLQATPFTRVVSTWTVPNDGKGAADSLVTRTCLGTQACVFHKYAGTATRDTTVFLNYPAIGESATGSVQVTSYRRATSDSTLVNFGPVVAVDGGRAEGYWSRRCSYLRSVSEQGPGQRTCKTSESTCQCEREGKAIKHTEAWLLRVALT